jgi:hypothetical protein
MQRLIYSLQFHRPPKGDGSDDAPTVARGLQLTTRIAGGLIEPTLEALPGEQALLDLQYTLNHDGTLFFESGTVTFGDSELASLSFSSIGTGSLLGGCDSDGFSHGVVAWEVESGTGALEGASGAISSNFLVNLQTDELLDTHLGVVRLPDAGASVR